MLTPLCANWDRTNNMTNRKILKVNTRDLRVPCPRARLSDIDLIDGVNVYGGASIGGALTGALIEVADSHPEEAPPGLTDFFRTIHLRIGSKRLVAALEPFRSEIEFVPVCVDYQGRRIDGEYFVLNSLKRVKALDMGQSIVEIDEEVGIVGAQKVVLDETKLTDIQWCVVDEIQEVVVSQAIQDAIVKSGCIGCRFQAIEEFHF